MKKSEAERHLREMLYLIQKARANANDPFLGIVEPPGTPGPALTIEFLSDLMPWLFDDSKCPIDALVTVLDRSETDGILSPFDYYNLMTILYRFLPTLVAFSPLMRLDFPRELPSLPSLIGGWEPEEEET